MQSAQEVTDGQEKQGRENDRSQEASYQVGWWKGPRAET
jgi:hypothetical protein